MAALSTDGAGARHLIAMLALGFSTPTYSNLLRPFRSVNPYRPCTGCREIPYNRDAAALSGQRDAGSIEWPTMGRVPVDTWRTS